MATKCFKPYGGERMRVTAVDNLGRPKYGSCSSVVTEGWVDVRVSAELDEGNEVSTTTASGLVCLAEKPCPQLKWLNVAMQFCLVDPDLAALINPTFKKLTDYKGDSVGWEESYNQSCSEGIALEVWMKLSGFESDDRYAEGGWLYYLIPFISGGTIGDDEIGAGGLNLTLSGRTRKGSNWGRGPYSDVQLNPSPIPGGAPIRGPLLVPVAPDAPRRRFITELRPPVALCGCQPLSNPDGPLVSINEDPTDLSRSTVTVNVGSSGVYRVDWGDGTAAQDVPPAGVSHKYTKRGKFNVSVWQTANPLLITIKQVTIPFEGAVLPAVIVKEDPADAVNRRSVIVTVNNHGNGAVVLDFGDATATVNNPGDGVTESTHTYAISGQFTVTYTDASDATRTGTVQLKVPFGLAKPTVTVTQDPVDPTRQTALIKVDNHGNGAVVIDWADGSLAANNPGDGVTETAHLFAAPGVYQVKTTDASDNSAQTVTPVTVPFPPPVPAFTTTEDTTDATHRTAKVQVTNPGAGRIYQVRWEAAGAFTDMPTAGAGANSATHQYAAGQADYVITVRDKVDITKTADDPITMPFGPEFSPAEEPGDVDRRTVRVTVLNPGVGKTYEIRWTAADAFADLPTGGATPHSATNKYGAAGTNQITVRDKADVTFTRAHDVTVPFAT